MIIIQKLLGCFIVYVGYTCKNYSYAGFLIISNFSLNVSTEASEMMRDISLLFTGRSWLSSLPLWSSLSMLCLVSASWLTSLFLTFLPASISRSSGRGIWQKRPYRWLRRLSSKRQSILGFDCKTELLDRA